MSATVLKNGSENQGQCEKGIEQAKEPGSQEVFRQFVIGKLEAQDKKEITVSNIRFWENGDAVADVSYLWTLNGHEKHAEHKDSIFVKKDSIWLSPVLF